MSRRRRKRTLFDESLIMNTHTYEYYVSRLTELALSVFEWKNMPISIDAEYIERSLFDNGMAVFFYDEVLGYLGLKVAANGPFNPYEIPIYRRAYSSNGFNIDLDINNSVIIYNNIIRTPSVMDICSFARILYDIDCTIIVNMRSQKTPIMITGSEEQKLTLLNLYKEYDGNSPFIFGDKNIDLNALKVLKTDAPFVAPKLYELKVAYWNEALTYIGIPNVNVQKRERLITDEVERTLAGAIASRNSRLKARRRACGLINNMFGLNIWCDVDESLNGKENDNETEIIEEGSDENE